MEEIDEKIVLQTVNGAVALKKLGITAGVVAVAVLAIAYAYTSERSEKAQLTMEAEPVVSEPAAMSPAPVAVEDAEIRLEAVATEAPAMKEQTSKTRGLLMTQDRTGTECKTPSGLVCTVDPGRINSPCACDGQNGLIIR